MKPTLYTLQVSNDGITFTDATNFRTNAVITATNLDTIWNYIHRYRESNTAYYYRIKGTAGNATPIYSNVINKTYKLLSNLRKGLNYSNGTVWIMNNTSGSVVEYRTGGKIRNVKKSAVVSPYIQSTPMGKYGDELIFHNIKNTYTTDGHGQIVAYNTLTEAIRVVATIENTDLYPTGNKNSLTTDGLIDGDYLYFFDVTSVLRKINLATGAKQSFNSGRVAMDTTSVQNWSNIFKVGDFIYFLPSRFENAANRMKWFLFNTTTNTFTTKDILNPNNINVTNWRVGGSSTALMFTNLINNKFIALPHSLQTLILEMEIIPSTQDVRINSQLGTVTGVATQYLEGSYDTNGKFITGSYTLNTALEINGGTVTSVPMTGLSEVTLAYDGTTIRTRQTADAIITPNAGGSVVNPLDPEHNRM